MALFRCQNGQEAIEPVSMGSQSGMSFSVTEGKYYSLSFGSTSSDPTLNVTGADVLAQTSAAGYTITYIVKATASTITTNHSGVGVIQLN